MFPKPLELGLKKMGNVKCQQSNFCSINFVNILKKSACMECLFITSYDIHLFRAGTSLNGFLSKSLVYCEKMSEWAIRSKKRAIRSFANFWWATWAICSHHSFLVSDLSNSLTSLPKKEGMNESLIFLN